MKCVICEKVLTRIPKVINQVERCSSCGSKYYIEVGDFSDVLESVMDFLDVTNVREIVVEQETDDKAIIKYKDKVAIAVLAERAKDEHDLDLWFVFIPEYNIKDFFERFNLITNIINRKTIKKIIEVLFTDHELEVRDIAVKAKISIHSAYKILKELEEMKIVKLTGSRPKKYKLSENMKALIDLILKWSYH